MRDDHSKQDKADVSRLLRQTAAGDLASADALLPVVYAELRRLAAQELRRERPGQTLDATGLVHEAYLRLVGEEDPGWSGRGHFFGAAARAMRRILVDRARRKGREKHGGAHRRVELELEDVANAAPEGDVLAVEEALAKLEAQDVRKGRLLELRYFGGLGAEEAAQALEVSLATVERDWSFVKAWLRTELGEAGSH